MHYERDNSRELLHLDTKNLGRIKGVGHRIHGGRRNVLRIRSIGWDVAALAEPLVSASSRLEATTRIWSRSRTQPDTGVYLLDARRLGAYRKAVGARTKTDRCSGCSCEHRQRGPRMCDYIDGDRPERGAAPPPFKRDR